MKGKPKHPAPATHRLLEALTGATYVRTRDFERVLAALRAGATGVSVEVPWGAGGGFHQLILVRLEGDRLHFINPAGHTSGGSLTRRVEGDGTESCRLADLRALFEAGNGEALLKA